MVVEGAPTDEVWMACGRQTLFLQLHPTIEYLANLLTEL